MSDADGAGATTRVGIVGAGAAGAGAAYALRDADAAVTILEKSGGVCGRAATRRKHGCHYDYGANYVNATDERTADLLETLGTDGLAEITEPVWTFDGAGTLSTGDGRESRKYSWERGVTQLAKRLFARTGATVHRRTRVAEMTRVSSAMSLDGSDTDASESAVWMLTDESGGRHGPFDVVLLTPPAPQTADLLRATEWRDERRERLIEAAAAVPYRTIRTVVLNYAFREPYPWYGLVNTDRDHAIGWLSREECKRGHVPDGESLLVVQMAPDWSTARYDEPLAEILPDVTDCVATLLDDDRYRDPEWVDDQGWRYALPDGVVDDALLSEVAEAGLYVAGDWVTGEGRVPAALWNGVDTGRRIAAAR